MGIAIMYMVQEAFRNLAIACQHQKNLNLEEDSHWSNSACSISNLYTWFTKFPDQTAACCIYRKLTKIRPPFLHTTFRQKWGRVHLLEYSVGLMHTPPPSVPCSLECARIGQSRRLTWLSERTAASSDVYYGKSAVLELTLSQEAPKQLASSVVSSHSQCEQQKP